MSGTAELFENTKLSNETPSDRPHGIQRRPYKRAAPIPATPSLSLFLQVIDCSVDANHHLPVMHFNTAALVGLMVAIPSSASPITASDAAAAGLEKRNDPQCLNRGPGVSIGMVSLNSRVFTDRFTGDPGQPHSAH